MLVSYFYLLFESEKYGNNLFLSLNANYINIILNHRSLLLAVAKNIIKINIFTDKLDTIKSYIFVKKQILLSGTMTVHIIK